MSRVLITIRVETGSPPRQQFHELTREHVMTSDPNEWLVQEVERKLARGARELLDCLVKLYGDVRDAPASYSLLDPQAHRPLTGTCTCGGRAD